MKKCNTCNVYINDTSDVCLLCGEKIQKINDEKEERLYPQLEVELKKYRKFYRVIGIVSMIISIVSIIINYLTFDKLSIRWSLLLNGAIIYFWISVAYSVRKNRSTTSKIILQSILLDILAILIDLSKKYTGISINYVVPLISIITNLIILTIIIINRTNFKKYLMNQLSACLVGLLPFICMPFGLIYRYVPLVICTIINFGIFCITIIRRRVEVKDEYIRRFHF